MYYLAFAIFFALNFSIWFMLPSFALKFLTKKGRKRKDDKLRIELIFYGLATLIYVFIYVMFYRYFNIAIHDIKDMSSDGINYFTSEINNLSLVIILFFIISLVYVIYTFYLARKSFKLNKVNLGYVLCCLTGFFNIMTYWFSNTILKLNMYSFTVEHHILNTFMKIDYEFLMFLFPILVFIDFALSFTEEK